MSKLIEALEALKSYRLDGLGYQSMAGFSYVKLEEVLAVVRQHEEQWHENSTKGRITAQEKR